MAQFDIIAEFWDDQRKDVEGCFWRFAWLHSICIVYVR